MFILIGLGNPGKKYASTRHNAGKMLVGYLRRRPVAGLEASETDCFMNQSGEFVRQKIQNTQKTQMAGISEKSENQITGNSGFPVLRVSDLSGAPSIPSFPKLIIAHDDLDLKLGEWKIHFGRGPRLHKGILSIEQALGTKDFWRVRIGVDNREQITENREQGEDYVLQPFRREEKKILSQTFGQIRECIYSIPGCGD
jgi:PTH1 family peptidyl-tRNA hydrolase